MSDYCNHIKSTNDTTWDIIFDLTKKTNRTEKEEVALRQCREIRRRVSFTGICALLAVIASTHLTSRIYPLGILAILFIVYATIKSMMQIFEDAHDYFAKDWYEYFRAEKEKRAKQAEAAAKAEAKSKEEPVIVDEVILEPEPEVKPKQSKTKA